MTTFTPTTTHVVPYSDSLKAEWNEWVRNAKNGVFLFDRNYMEYHSDRFEDFSLLFYKDGKLIAVLPASRQGAEIISHGGLTFGGFLTAPSMRAALMLELFEALITYLKSQNIQKLRYKSVPYIYHTHPADEDLYALFRYSGQLVRRDISSTIRMDERIRYSKGRKYSLKQAEKQGLTVAESTDYTGFMAIEHAILAQKYGATPTHSAEELSLLASRFPSNIKLYTAQSGETLLGGVVIYESATLAHAQYIAASEEGKTCGAVDVVIDHLLKNVYAEKRYFDFGISTENQGHYLNENLIAQKEMFGARATVYDTYEILLN